MSSYIKKALDKELKLVITPDKLKELIKFVIFWELRDEHSLTLNTPLLGVNEIIWTPQDTNSVLEIFEVDIIDVKEIVNTIPSINKEWKVTSNPFNIFCIYLLHKITIFKGPNTKALEALLNILQCKLFSSVVRNSFPHKAKESIMRFTIENLTRRFSITELNTWKNVICDRTERLLSSSGLHKDTFNKFDADNEILYAISDIQTQVRNQIVAIARAYYDNVKLGSLIDSYTLFTTSDSQRIMKEIPGIYDLIKHNLFAELSNRVVFINHSYLDIVLQLTKTTNGKLIRNFLDFISSLAKKQKASKDLEKIIITKDFDYFVGVGGLSFKIISTIFNSCFKNKINVKSKLAVLKHAQSIFLASRTNNSDIINIKKSLNKLILISKISKRAMTISIISLNYILYIMLKSFESVKR